MRESGIELSKFRNVHFEVRERAVISREEPEKTRAARPRRLTATDVPRKAVPHAP